MSIPITRAEALTGVQKNKEFFSDFLLNFNKSPLGDDLARVTNDHAVNQSLRNLIKTNLGERLFQPMVGSDVYATLFENNTEQNRTLLELQIRTTIENNEPRVIISQVLVEEGKIEEEVEITIIYQLINNPEEVTLNMILKRVR